MTQPRQFQEETKSWWTEWQKRLQKEMEREATWPILPVKAAWPILPVKAERPEAPAEGITPAGMEGSTPSDGPTFQEVFREIFDEAFDLLVERQRKYGPENIRMLGMYGVFSRLASDKIERVRRGMNGTVVHGEVRLEYTDFGDESFDDALLDIANYALIMLCLKRGLWGAPLE